jgi:hypothetical protein
MIKATHNQPNPQHFAASECGRGSFESSSSPRSVVLDEVKQSPKGSENPFRHIFPVEKKRDSGDKMAAHKWRDAIPQIYPI